MMSTSKNNEEAQVADIDEAKPEGNVNYLGTKCL